MSLSFDIKGPQVPTVTMGGAKDLAFREAVRSELTGRDFEVVLKSGDTVSVSGNDVDMYIKADEKNIQQHDLSLINAYKQTGSIEEYAMEIAQKIAERRESLSPSFLRDLDTQVNKIEEKILDSYNDIYKHYRNKAHSNNAEGDVASITAYTNATTRMYQDRAEDLMYQNFLVAERARLGLYDTSEIKSIMLSNITATKHYMQTAKELVHD